VEKLELAEKRPVGDGVRNDFTGNSYFRFFRENPQVPHDKDTINKNRNCINKSGYSEHHRHAAIGKPGNLEVEPRRQENKRPGESGKPVFINSKNL